MSRLVFVGDVIADDTVDAATLRATLAHAAGDRAATAIGNLEIPVCEEDAGTPPPKTLTWRSPATTAARLAAGGLHVLGLANNHSASWGIAGLLRSRDVLREAGITPIGAGDDLHEAMEPWTSPAGDVAVFALSCTVPQDSAAADRRAGTFALRIDTRIAIDPLRSVELPLAPPEVTGRFEPRQIAPLIERIRHLSGRGTTVAVFLHWGPLYTMGVFDHQLALSELLIDAGARLLVGCHSHMPGPVARYRDGLVLFSLGNFLWSPGVLEHARARIPRIGALFERWARVGLALRADVDGDGVRDARLVAVELVRGIPRPLADATDRQRLAGLLRWASEHEISRAGWTPADLMPEVPGWFPLGFRAEQRQRMPA